MILSNSAPTAGAADFLETLVIEIVERNGAPSRRSAAVLPLERFFKRFRERHDRVALLLGVRGEPQTFGLRRLPPGRAGISVSDGKRQKPDHGSESLAPFKVTEDFAHGGRLRIGQSRLHGADEHGIVDVGLPDALHEFERVNARAFARAEVRLHARFFGIVEFDQKGRAISLEEKPKKPKSNYCVTGLYFYDNQVVEYAKGLKPSARGELEITDLNRIYLAQGNLHVEILGQGFTWLDTGTHESMVDATNFVKAVETHQRRKVACIEEIAYLNGWITKEQALKLCEPMLKNGYGQYLKDVIDGKYLDGLY